MPAQEGSWCRQPVLVRHLGESAHQCGEHGAIGPLQSRAGVGAAQHGDLVPEDQQFDVLGRR
ncbi:hypothetical protein [Saccharothrix longispora]|uniref:hypothetical protein n=1 Tax=Saccharothrix longispora TaxID=33920 RepID=UPI0028FD68D2|nr:hypothetical protein [Saccharothrix longispora]MDU0288151.1 hypothetical protein [Saccharothrix longispora]